MSRYHVPVPDYDFTVRQQKYVPARNPYIPTPDYTLKNQKQKNRPSLNNIGTEFAPQNAPEFYELPPIYIPIEVPPPALVKEQSSRRPTNSDRQSISKLPDENYNYPEVRFIQICKLVLIANLLKFWKKKKNVIWVLV